MDLIDSFLEDNDDDQDLALSIFQNVYMCFLIKTIYVLELCSPMLAQVILTQQMINQFQGSF